MLSRAWLIVMAQQGADTQAAVAGTEARAGESSAGGNEQD